MVPEPYLPSGPDFHGLGFHSVVLASVLHELGIKTAAFRRAGQLNLIEFWPSPVDERPERYICLYSGDSGKLVSPHRVGFHPFLYLAYMVVMIVGDYSIIKPAFANRGQKVLDVTRINFHRSGVAVGLRRNPVELRWLVINKLTGIDNHRCSVGKNDERAFSTC